eukprot:jgi/Mesen1/4877/ME000244S04047
MHRWEGFAYAAAAAVGHSCIDASRKIASQRFSSAELVGLVGLLDAIFLSTFIFGTGMVTSMDFMDYQLATILLASAAVKVLAGVMYQRALQVSPLSVTVPYLAFTPALLIFTSYLMIHEVPSSQGVVGVIVVTAGGYLLALEGGKSPPPKRPKWDANSKSAHASPAPSPSPPRSGASAGAGDKKKKQQLSSLSSSASSASANSSKLLAFGSSGLNGHLSPSRLHLGERDGGEGAGSPCSPRSRLRPGLEVVVEGDDAPSRARQLQQQLQHAGEPEVSLVGMGPRSTEFRPAGMDQQLPGPARDSLMMRGRVGAVPRPGVVTHGLSPPGGYAGGHVASPLGATDGEARGGPLPYETASPTRGLNYVAPGRGAGRGLRVPAPLVLPPGPGSSDSEEEDNNDVDKHGHAGMSLLSAPVTVQSISAFGWTILSLLRLRAQKVAEPLQALRREEGSLLMLGVAALLSLTNSPRAFVNLVRYFPIMAAISFFEIFAIVCYLKSLDVLLVSYSIAAKRSNILISVMVGKIVFKEQIWQRLPYITLMMLGMALIVFA